MPDKVKVLYDALAGEYDLGSFDEFRSKMSDQTKRKALYDAAGKDYDLGTFDEFNRKMSPAGPVAPAQTPVQGIPTFQEQLPTMQANRFDEAVSKDKKKSGSYIGALYDSFVSAVDPLMYIGDEAFLGAYQYMSGKKLAPQEKQAIRKAIGTTMEVAGARPRKTQDEGVVEGIQGGWDLSDGFGSKDLKALGLMGSRVAGDLAISAASTAVGVPPGSTYFAQGYGSGLQDYNDMVAKGSLEENGLAKQTYALTVGTINGLLEKLAFDKIFGKGPAFDAVKKKVTADVLKQVAKSNTKVTMDVVEKVGEQMLKKELSSLGKRGARAGYAAGVESLTEGTQAGLEDAAKLLTNAVQGQQVFDENDIKKNFVKNVLNSAAAGFALGAPMGIASTMMSNVDNTLVKEIAKAKDETELNSVISELEESMAKSNASEEEIDAMRQSAIKYNSIKQTIPPTVSDEAKSNIISLIDRRNGIDEKMTNWQAELETVDESMKPDVESEMTTLVDAKELINDEIRENAAGGKFTYIEDNGKYFKQFEGEDPIEIKKSTYELKKSIEDATKKSQGPIQEGGTVSDISQRQGTQEGGAQKAPIETNLGDSNLDGEEISVKSLIGRRVTYQGVTGTLFQEGQTLSIETPTQIREIGNVDELSQVTPESIGIESDESLVEPTENGFMIGTDELFNRNENPIAAISRDQNGKVMNVVLTTKSGKRRKFRGAVAEDLAYQITLKQISNEPEFEVFLEQNADEINAGQVQEPAQEGATRTDEQIPAVEGAAQPATEPTIQPTEPTARPTTEPSVTSEPAFGKIIADQPNKIPRGLNRLQRKVVKDALRVVESIIRPVQDLTGNKPTVHLHNKATFAQAVIEAGGTEQDSGSRGFYLATDGTIHLNMDNVASDTMLHEGFHPILDFLERYNPYIIGNLFSELQTIEGASKIIEQAERNYSGGPTQRKEAITDFVAGVADGRIVINPNNFQKIRKFILDMLNKLGISQTEVKFMNAKNKTDLVELADFVTEIFREGEYITRAELESFTGLTNEQLGNFTESTPTPDNPIAKSGQLQFMKTIYDKSGIEKSPALDKEEFNKAVQDGRISVANPYKSLSGRYFAITFPDDFFTGEIKYDNKTIAYGNGGVFFAAKFGDKGDLWAAAGETSARNFVIQGNESRKRNNGEGVIVLSKGDDIKQSTSLEANIALINTIIKYAEKNNELASVVKAIKTTYSVGRAKSADSIIASFNEYLKGGRGESGQRMVDAKSAFNVLSSALIKESGPLMTKMLRDMGFDGGDYFDKTKLKKGEYVATTQGIKAMYVDLLQEDFLKGLNNGAVYAALRFDSDIKFEKDPYHPSYPLVIRTVDDSPIRLEVFSKTFNSYGKEGVAIYGQERNNENAFGVATTTKPDFRLDESFEDNPSQRSLSDKLNQYESFKKGPAFQRVAPNGQPSKLNANQYEQVRTPEFKNWFGDWETNPESASKALDENGEPLVLFHGTKAKFDQFEYNKMSWESRLSQQGPGFYMTDNKKAASQYGKPMNVFTSVKNPLVIDNRSSNITKEQAYQLFSNGDNKWFYESYLPFYTKSEGLSKEELIKKYVDDMSGVRGFDKEVLQNIKRSYNQDKSYDKMMSDVAGILGKDGVIEKVSDGLSVYVAFTPNQIKSATENVGAFSTQDDRIQFQKQTPTKETRKPVKVAGRTVISSKKKATIDNLFTSSGPLGPAIRTFKEQMGGELTAEVNIAERLTKEAMKLMEKYKGIINTKDVENFLSGKSTATALPLDLATKLTEMRVHVDKLTDRLLDLNVIEDKETRQLYMDNKGKYLLRSYELFRAKGPVTVENVTKKLKNVDQAKVDAALKVLEEQIKKDEPNLTPQELKEKAISQANFYLSDEDMAFGGRPIEGSVNAKSLSQRSQYLEDNPAIRALMGEYTDPMYKYYSSIFKLANIVSHRDYLNKLKAEGMGKFFFKESTGEATAKIASWETKSLAPLGNLYTFPELKEALMVAEREKKNLLWMLAGQVRMMKTVYNPATHVKNLLGSMAFAISNGHWMYLGKTLSYMKKSKSKELMELIDVLNREGVLNNNIGVGEINQYFKKHDNVDDLLKDINLKFNKETAAYLGQKATVNLKKIPNGLKKLYALEDDIFKILGFVNETNLYARAEYNKDFDALNPDEKAKIIKEAAERVKSFYPTFSRVPKFVKGASKAFFLGNFLSFPVESVRVSYNTISQGVKEARSSNPKIKAIGINRLAGTLLYNGAMTWLLTYASMAAGQGLSGVLGYIFDDEDEIEKRDKAKKFRTPWNKDSQVLVNKFSDGKLVYSDMGSIDSYGYQREVWNTFWDNMSDKKGFNKAMAETIAKTVQPYTELDMTLEAVLNIMDGKDEFGNDIANSEAPYSERVKDYTKYISSKFAPGVINSVFKAYRLTQEGDDEAVINEALSQLVRTYTIDLEKSFTNYVYANPGEKNTGETGFKKRLDNAESIYNSVKNSKSMSDSEKESYYQMAVEAYKNVLRDVSGYYEAAVAGGVDPNKLNQILMRSKLADQRSLPELISIIQNRYDLPDEIYIRR